MSDSDSSGSESEPSTYQYDKRHKIQLSLDMLKASQERRKAQPLDCGPNVLPANATRTPMIDFKTVKHWAMDTDQKDLVNAVHKNLDTLKQVLRRESLPVDWVHFLALTFQKVLQDKTHKVWVSDIMLAVAHSSFLDRHLVVFLKQVQDNKSVMSVVSSSLRAFFDILDFIVMRYSDCLNKSYVCVCKMEEFGKQFNILPEGSDLNNQCFQLKETSCPIPMLEESLLNSNNGLRAYRREKHIISLDNEIPPDDFREQSIFPSMEELNADAASFLRANKTTGPYRNILHYTDVHFRLLREDYLSPLRDGLRDYKKCLEEDQEVHTNHLRFYHNCKVAKMTIDNNDGLLFTVKFDMRDIKEEIRWEYSKRFLFGSLLGFSKDNFKTVIFATVVNRDPEKLKFGQLEVCFQSNLEQILVSSDKDSFVIAETISLFESYKHVLEGLQETEVLPLADYILYCIPTPNPPEYLTQHTRFDLGCIMKEEEEMRVAILEPSDWPEHDSTILNAAQLEAVKLALTNEIAVIQGPPGTGKTYVGLLVTQIILNNMPVIENDNRSPILVVCYSNHALDQFLEGILEFCEGGIIRVGGRSKSEKLEEFNLKKLRANPLMDKRLKKAINTDLRESRTRLKKVSHRIKRLRHEILDLDTCIQSKTSLEEEMTEKQIQSLSDPSRVESSEREMNVWLKAANASFEKDLGKSAEKHLIRLILEQENDPIEDTVLLDQNIRQRFALRAQIYQGWVLKYKEAFPECNKADEDILSDDEILPFMTSEKIFENIEFCVRRECKNEPQSVATIRRWLLGYFQNVDQILNEIEKRTKHAGTDKKIPFNDYVPRKKFEEDRVVIDSEDDDDDDDDDDYEEDDNLRGFQDHGENVDSESERSSVTEDENTNLLREYKDLEIDFRQTESRTRVLSERARMLGIEIIEDEEDEREGQSWQAANQMTYSKVMKIIENAKPLSEEEADEIEDVWSITVPKRYRLYKFWILSKKEKIAQMIVELTEIYDHFLNLKKAALYKKDAAILKQGQVIGMTTTGAARYRGVLQKVRPKIIIVEEAAEVLEAHIVTTLNEHCKHLILIGDHQQLRPNPTVHRLAIDYNLEISLFERMVKNSVRHVTLQVQHRMRPEISSYLLNIYPRLRDHASVSHYENVKGMGANVYFISHSYRETDVFETMTKANSYEAEYLVNLCRYLMQQGYTGSQITILAAYNGQVNCLREYMEPEVREYMDPEEKEFKDVRVTSIDNYQGEENDIILLSLVRSNITQQVGFLKTNNRVCVALSRARIGLFVIGNLPHLEMASQLWKNILRKARTRNQYGVNLKLVCSNHAQHETFIQNAKEFLTQAPEGGCSQPCRYVLPCGHECPRLCHISDRNHMEILCQEQCQKVCPEGHVCRKGCSEDCGKCDFLVEKEMLLCGHRDYVPCHQDSTDASCGKPCNQSLPCGHICKGICGQCSKNEQHKDCEEKVEKLWNICGDKSTVPCFTDVKISSCPAKCKEKLQCGHLCKGTCGECLTKRVHKPCQAKCPLALPCGHQCQSKCGTPCEPCSARCPFRCRHAPCSKSYCGETCGVCKENCAFVCKHRQCSERCADECKERPCNQPCSKLLSCKHQCKSICSETCVCFKCDENSLFALIDFDKSSPGHTVIASKERAKKFSIDEKTVFMKIPVCGHVFTMSQLDKFVNIYDPDGTSYIKCPKPRCTSYIQGIIRYDFINKKRSLKRENRKYELRRFNTVAQNDIESLEYSLDIVKNFCPFDLEHYLKHQNQPIQVSHAEALRSLSRYAFVLYMIVDIHQDFNPNVHFSPKKWKDSLSSNQLRTTPQYEQEMKMELYRLLMLEQVLAYKNVLSDAEVTIEEPLKTQMKNLMKPFPFNAKRDSKLVISKLEEMLSSSEVTFSAKESCDSLANRVNLAHTILDKPRNVYLNTILDEMGLLPEPVGDDLSESGSSDFDSNEDEH